MSKNVKIIVILAITALVIGMLIYFYKKNKKAEAEKIAPSEPPVVNPEKVKRMRDMKAAGMVSVAGPKQPVGGPAMSTD